MLRICLVRCDDGLVISSDSSKTRQSFPDVRLTNFGSPRFSFGEDGGGEDEEYTFRYCFQIGITSDYTEFLPIDCQKRYPSHIGGNGRSQNDGIAYLMEFKQVFCPMIHGCRLAGTLLPVQ